MARLTFSSKWGKVKVDKKPVASGDVNKSVEDSVRQMKAAQKSPAGEDYREKSLALHGLVCGRCGREFTGLNRHLLTVHHKDGNHHNNPADGSNWENLCAYCHEDVHSREVLADYLGDGGSEREFSVVYEEKPAETGGTGTLAEKLKKALQKR
ncbi:MAG: HNH nuclease family protein [Syntrophaceae bacterium]|nr:HNH nuclease family protein [Syntrophaceae bacterium]